MLSIWQWSRYAAATLTPPPRTLTAEPGTYTVSGSGATLSVGHVLTAQPGAYAVSGTAATLRAHRRLGTDAGAYTVTGSPATLTAVAPIQLVALPGSYALTGAAAGLARSRGLVALPGSYALSGTAATLARPGRALVADPGLYLITGKEARLRYSEEVPPFVVVQVLTRRMRRSAHIADEDRWLFHRALQIDMETGVGLSDGQGRDPQVMLRWSDDGGDTWSHEHWQSAGKMGEYHARVVWERLGRSRDRVYETVVSDPVAWHLLAAILDLEPGLH